MLVRTNWGSACFNSESTMLAFLRPLHGTNFNAMPAQSAREIKPIRVSDWFSDTRGKPDNSKRKTLRTHRCGK